MGLERLGQETGEVSPETSVMQAVKVMTDRSIGALAVTRAGRAIGIFTERDLMRRVVLPGRDPHDTPISQVMTSPVQSVPGSTSVAEAAALMRQHHIRHLAVVDAEGRLVTLVALRYLLYDLLEDLDRKVDSLQSYIMADAPGG